VTAAVCALFVGRKFHRGVGVVRDRQVWKSKPLAIDNALEMAIGMRAAGVRRVWLEADDRPARTIPRETLT
jgi:hypothetical protein